MERGGLRTEEAKKNLQTYGKNELKETSLASPFKILFRQVKKNFVVYMLVFAMILSFVIHKNVTAYTLLFVILIVIGVGFIQEYRAERVIKSLKKMIMHISIVIRDDREQEVLSAELVPGDILILRSGEKVPADCIILDASELTVNEAILTGESKEVSKIAVKDEKHYKEQNQLFMGSFIFNGRCTAKIIHTGMNTKFGQISSMISSAEKQMPLQEKVNHISKYMVFVALIFSFLTGLIMFFQAGFAKDQVFEILLVIIALSVSAFPEGFPVVLITALATGAYKMAQKNAIVNRMSIIETLGETTVICADKTGTITKGEMTVVKLFADNKIFDISGAGYEAAGEFSLDGRKIDPNKDPVITQAFLSSILCNDSKIERTGEDMIYRMIGTPTEASLLIMAAKAGIFREDLNHERLKDLPFSSERKMMSMLYKYEKKKTLYSKGALEILLPKCKFIQRHNGIFTLTEGEKKRILKQNRILTANSFRTIGLAYREIKKDIKDDKDLEKELVFIGIAGIQDPPREEVKESIIECKRAGISVKMVTGDNKETALAIGKRIGLVGRVLEGNDLDKMSDQELSKVCQEVVIFARVRPEHKIKIVRALKLVGEIVTMTGDGVNDAPALKEAHIGVAMGKNGTDVSREVADLTLKDDNFATIVSAIKEGRTIFKNIRKFISYQLSCNYAELAIIFFGVLLAPLLSWQIPLLLAIQILFMNLVTDDLPALTLSLNKASDDVMEEPPRKKAKILHKSHLIWIAISGMLMAIFSLAIFYIAHDVWNRSFEMSRTIALVSLILLEIAGAFNFRSFRKKVTFKSFMKNPYLVYASILSILATVVIIYTPVRKVLYTTSIGLPGWSLAIASALILVLILNILKSINNNEKILNLEERDLG